MAQRDRSARSPPTRRAVSVASGRRWRRSRQLTLLEELDKQGAAYIEVATGVQKALDEGRTHEELPYALRKRREMFN
jgi:hypothetical protein